MSFRTRLQSALLFLLVAHSTGSVTAAQSAKIEAGHVYLPADAPWLADFVAEVLGFPYARHDDQIDSLSQFLSWASSRRDDPPITISLHGPGHPPLACRGRGLATSADPHRNPRTNPATCDARFEHRVVRHMARIDRAPPRQAARGARDRPRRSHRRRDDDTVTPARPRTARLRRRCVPRGRDCRRRARAPAPITVFPAGKIGLDRLHGCAVRSGRGDHGDRLSWRNRDAQ